MGINNLQTARENWELWGVPYDISNTLQKSINLGQKHTLDRNVKYTIIVITEYWRIHVPSKLVDVIRNSFE